MAIFNFFFFLLTDSESWTKLNILLISYNENLLFFSKSTRDRSLNIDTDKNNHSYLFVRSVLECDLISFGYLIRDDKILERDQCILLLIRFCSFYDSINSKIGFLKIFMQFSRKMNFTILLYLHIWSKKWLIFLG